MSMSFGFRLALLCSVCGQSHDGEVEIRNRTMATLFGYAEGFPYCPCCWNDAQHLAYSIRYQRRAAKWAGVVDEPYRFAPEPPDPMLSPVPWTDAVLGAMVRRPPVRVTS
jgi:hypothetical protein